MTKKKQTTNQTQSAQSTNTYGYMSPPDTADMNAVRDFKFTADPSIGYAFGSAKNQVVNSFNNPLGGVYNANMRDNILRSSLSDLAQQESQAKSGAHQQAQGMDYARKSAVAQLTSPRLIQTGGSSTGSMSGSTTQSGGLLGDILIGGATGAGQGAGAAA